MAPTGNSLELSSSQAATLLEGGASLERKLFEQLVPGRRFPITYEELTAFADKEAELFAQGLNPADAHEFNTNWSVEKLTESPDDLKKYAESQSRYLRILARQQAKFRPLIPSKVDDKEIQVVTVEDTKFPAHVTEGQRILYATTRRSNGREPPNYLPQRSKVVDVGKCTNIVVRHPMMVLPGHITYNIVRDDDAFNLTGGKKLIIFIPGYNQSFDQGITCMYKLREALSREGLVGLEKLSFAVFSWPSYGDYGYLGSGIDMSALAHVLYYLVDLAACEGSEGLFPDFIDERLSSAEEIHFIGHSMGCRLLIRALRDIDKKRQVARIKSVTFAAPDVDRQMFTTLLNDIQKQGGFENCKFLLLQSSKDVALNGSKVLHNAPRAGLADNTGDAPACLAIDSSNFNRDWTIRYYDDLTNLLTHHFDFLYAPDCVKAIARNIMGTMDQGGFLDSLPNHSVIIPSKPHVLSSNL